MRHHGPHLHDQLAGHTASWGKGYPDLLTDCYSKKGKPLGIKGPINPARNESYELLWSLLMEVATVFPDQYVHMGGDEVPFDCWKVALRASHHLTLLLISILAWDHLFSLFWDLKSCISPIMQYNCTLQMLCLSNVDVHQISLLPSGIILKGLYSILCRRV